MILTVTFYFFSVFILTATVLPFFRKDHWTFRIFEFPRLQKLFLITGILILGFLLPGERSLAIRILLMLLILNCIYLMYLIFPFTPLSRKTMPGIHRYKAQNPLKLLIANVFQPNQNYHKLLAHIKTRDPDIIFLVETDKKWQEALTEIEKDYPYTVLQPRKNTYGLLLYSKLELKDVEVRHLIEEEVPGLKLIIRTGTGQEIRFFGVHPEPPSPTENPYSTERDAELLIIARECENEDRPVIVAGDLNDVAWSYTTERFLDISGLLDPRRGRGIYSTFHAKYFFMRWPLDHIFCSSHFRLIKMKRLRNIGSDHFPVWIELELNTQTSRQR